MSEIRIKMLTGEAHSYITKNIERITRLIQEHDSNEWVYHLPVSKLFVEKNYIISDFELHDNPDDSNKELTFENSKILYENLNAIPNYIICDNKFWLWLHLEQFYLVTKRMMTINGISTVKDHWLFTGGKRRGLFFGVLSRLFFRVDLSIDVNIEDKYILTKWISNKPYRIREYTWRNISSQKHVIRGCIKGEKRAIDELGEVYETGKVYDELAKYLSLVGSSKLLDAFDERDIEVLIYNKAIEILTTKVDV